MRVRLGNDTSGRPLTVDYSTLAKLRLAEKRLGHTFVIVQGSWRGEDGADASAGTHDRGGVIDLRSRDLPGHIPPQAAVSELRRAGLIAWYRTQAQGFDPHIHAIDHGNPDLAASAARQVTAWRNGRNGLANNGPDDGAKVPVPTATPTEGFMFLTKDDLDAIRAMVREELAAAGDTVRIDHDNDPKTPKYSLSTMLRWIRNTAAPKA
jgi:hypothetical protein